MPIIEGIGDEVLQFFGFLLATFIGVLAWWSTGIRERPQIRTVLILEHRSPNSVNTSQSSHPITNQQERSTNENLEVGTETLVANEGNTEENEGEENTSCTPVNRNAVTEQRKASFKGQTADATRGSVNEELNSDFQENQDRANSADNIRIRLKYLNDDQKLVEGRLQELLGDFKRRHFSGELSADKLVRLIFKGQVLQCDDRTLQGYGLYDNCVVHCLVHAQRSNVNRTNIQPHGNANPPECNLGLLLYASISVMLGIAWFFRYHYSQFFTISSTAGLIILTALFAVMVIGFHMPDQDAVPVQ